MIRGQGPTYRSSVVGDAGMPHDLLKHLRRVPGLDHQRRGGVPKVMKTKLRTDAGPAAGRQKDGTPPVRQPQCPAQPAPTEGRGRQPAT